MSTRTAARQESKLVRSLGFSDLMGIAIGQIIGAGIMSMTGTAIGMTGTGVVLAFILSPILTLITNIPITYMSSALPITGGGYRYVSRLLGKRWGFIHLVLFTIANMTIALYALGFASYWVSIWPGAERVVAAGMLIIFYLVNLRGSKSAALLNTIISCIMVGGILLFIGYGVPQVDFGHVFNVSNLFNKGAFGFMSALALLSFATGGAQVIAEVGGEAKNPGRNIPRAMIISTVGVGILYAFMACVAAGILPIGEVANQPLTAVANKVLPTPIFYIFIIGSAMGASATTMNATLSWVSKAFLVACEDGVLPKSLATVSNKGVPYKILTMFFVIGMLPIVTGFDISFVSKLGTSASLMSKIVLCSSFAFVFKKYPKQMESSILKIKPSTTKILSVVAAATSLILSISLVLALPIWAIVAFFCVLAVAAAYAILGLKNVSIPDDLGVDYTSNMEIQNEEPED